MRKKVIYIAGPFRAANQWEQEQNIRRAEELSLRVWRVGGVALCPHLNTRFFSGALPDEVWLEGDLELLRRCDAILMVQGWELSFGAVQERAFALEHGIMSFYAPSACTDFSTYFKEWIKKS